MARSPSDPFVERALELFSALDLPVSARRMFGGLGFYAGGLFFAIGDHEAGQLWLKVDDESRQAFEALGGQPFTYMTARREVMAMAYLSPPDEAMEDAEAMLPWASLAVAAARRAAAAKAAKVRAPKVRGARAQAPKARPTAAPAAGRRAARRGRS